MTEPENQPQDPTAPPTAPMTPIPSIPTPPLQATPPVQATPPTPSYPSTPAYPATPPAYPGGEPTSPVAPTSGFAVPPAAMAPYAGGGGADPLVPASPSFSDWFAKAREIGQRSWKSILFIVAIGIAAPRAIIALIQGALNVGNYINATEVTRVGSIFADFGAIVLGILVSIVLAILALFIAAAGWAGGAWAIVNEAAGQKVTVGDAFKYGSKKALGLGLWTIVVGVMVLIGFCLCFVPAIYLSFALSMFGFVAVFERGQNPIARSFKLTHADFGPTLGKYAVVGVIAFVYNLIVSIIFIPITAVLVFGTAGSTGYNILLGFVNAIEAIVGAPVWAIALIGLFPLYTQLRAREGGMSTAQLQHEMNV